MRKTLLLLTFLLSSVTVSAQWQPHSPSGLIRDTAEIHILVDQFWLDIRGLYTVDVVLYDSIGHPIQDWKNLDLRETEERYAYNRIWKHITESKGWVRFGTLDIPTLRKEDSDD